MNASLTIILPLDVTLRVWSGVSAKRAGPWPARTRAGKGQAGKGQASGQFGGGHGVCFYRLGRLTGVVTAGSSACKEGAQNGPGPGILGGLVSRHIA